MFCRVVSRASASCHSSVPLSDSFLVSCLIRHKLAPLLAGQGTRTPIKSATRSNVTTLQNFGALQFVLSKLIKFGNNNIKAYRWPVVCFVLASLMHRLDPLLCRTVTHNCFVSHNNSDPLRGCALLFTIVLRPTILDLKFYFAVTSIPICNAIY